MYFTGDSLERKSRKLGSRWRRGSLSEDLLDPQSQPMVGWGSGGKWLLGVQVEQSGAPSMQLYSIP